MSGKEQEIREVVAALDGLLDALRDNVGALNAILVPPEVPPPDAKEMV